MAMSLEIDGVVAALTLARPPVNALDLSALREIEGLLDRLEKDRDVRAIVIAGGINGVFCAGGDMKWWPRKYPDRPDLVSGLGRQLFDRIERLTKPTICLIDGKVIGDGLSLALACDLRVASRDSSFQVPEVSYGFIPGWGTIGRMIREIGKAAASELLLIGEPVDAEAALRVGLVHRVYESDEIDLMTWRLAAKLADKPPRAMSRAKAALRGPDGEDANGEITDDDWELACFQAVWGGEEWAAGVAGVFDGNSK